ncbi:hypothetical protein [Weissella paramesenteroides]|uniref:hypothetical protein n=1 Tax=Weissella paramesenteroides TaxID=1249 RepID=UPI0039825D09
MAAGPGYNSFSFPPETESYPKALTDEKFTTREKFYELENRVTQLETKEQGYEQKVNDKIKMEISNMEKTNLKTRLANATDIGKWVITTLIALVALGINLFK